MPSIITRGAASARGFGFAGRVATLTSTTFTSNGTWVAPSGVTNVTTLTGEGADGTPAGWSDYGDVPVVSVFANSASGYTSAYLEAQAQTEWDKFPTSYSSGGSTVSWDYYYYTTSGLDVYSYTSLIRLKSGYSKTKTGNGWGASYTPPTSTIYTYSVGNMQTYNDATTGASSTALGKTFPGGTGGAPTPTTFTNVTVTPGNSYSIVVPSGGFVTISYLA